MLLRFATFLAPNMFSVYRFIASYAGRRLGLATELIVGSSFDQFERGQADVGYICGLPYVLLTRRVPSPVELLAAPVLQGERYQDRPVYFSDVIVKKDSPHQSFAGLRGCSWSFNDPHSQSGYGITRYSLVKMGEINGFFDRVVEAGFHQASIRMVARGRVDASAIDSQTLAIELRDHPALAAQLRVIGALGPSSIQPVVAASRLPASLKQELRNLFLELAFDSTAQEHLTLGLIRRFAAVEDTGYDDIRNMLSACERAGFMVIR